MYLRFGKRALDLILSLCALVVLSPVLAALALVGACAMRGNPFFVQARPGKKDRSGQERIFSMLKFRTMSNQKDKNGCLLPDEQRLNGYGRFLRSTSLDELPELVNVLVGDCSMVGPRPQKISDMVYMTREQRRRHDVRPGITGLAQINGRNSISWTEKFQWDLQYIDSGITLKKDAVILLKTVGKVLKRSDVVREGTVSDLDYGPWLLQEGLLSREEYLEKEQEARRRELARA